MDITPSRLGEQEMSILQYVADHMPAAARDVAEAIGQERKIARTTVLTVLERLRRKGYLTRRRREGIFHYAPSESQPELLKNLVGQFIAKTLGGAFSPVVAYLSGNRQISERDLADLEKLVGELRAERGGNRQRDSSEQDMNTKSER